MGIEHISIPTADGIAEAYLATPNPDSATVSSVGPALPGVLFYMDAIGLRPQIESMIQRIAGWGYIVLAPNIFYRKKTIAEIAATRDLREPGARRAHFGKVMPLVKAHGSEEAARDAEAYLGVLTERSGTPFGVTGYCMGGRLALRIAAGHPDGCAALGMFHVGGLVTEDADSPHLSIPTITAEVLAGYADKDPSMPVSAVDTVVEALAASGITAKTSIRPAAAHGYTMADTSVYDEEACEWHFTHLRDLFDRTLQRAR